MSKFFVDRPIVAIVIAIITVLVGAVAAIGLPVAQFPQIVPPQIFVGATFTEIIFGWHGMGELFVTSIQGNDTNAVAAVTFFVAVGVLLASFLQDFIVALLDPRVRT